MTNISGTSVKQTKISTYPSWAHPDVHFYADSWELLRDCFLGEHQIKAKSTQYLPKMKAFDPVDYAEYLDRAVFYNMVGRTVGGLIGTVFRRAPVLEHIPDKMDMTNVGKDGSSFRTFSRIVAQEVLHMGRVGVLLDRDGTGLPYFATYIAECILSWKTGMVNGRMQLIEVVLREIVEDIDAGTFITRYLSKYRKLILENGRYRQEIYNPRTYDLSSNAAVSATNAVITAEPDEVIYPTNRGRNFDYIPFVIFGPVSCGWDIEKSPVLDIAALNISHYRSYAHLEHGRYYTGLPVYYAEVANGNTGGQYTIGPSTVWEVPVGGKAGIIEFNGNGLKFLENALEQKEAEIAAIGGRLIGVSSRSTSESNNQTAMKERNEQALLLGATLALDEGFERALRWMAVWQDVPQDEADAITCSFNKDFLFQQVGAREFRAIHAMYSEGVMPLEVIYDYFKRAEVIPDWMGVEEFRALLLRPESFPNQPDFTARQDGYPDMQSEINDGNADDERVVQVEVAEIAAKTAITVQDKAGAAAQKIAATKAALTSTAARPATTQSKQVGLQQQQQRAAARKTTVAKKKKGK